MVAAEVAKLLIPIPVKAHQDTQLSQRLSLRCAVGMFMGASGLTHMTYFSTTGCLLVMLTKGKHRGGPAAPTASPYELDCISCRMLHTNDVLESDVKVLFLKQRF